MGLGLGAAFLYFGLGDIAADHSRASQLGDAAIVGYVGDALAADGAPGPSSGLTIYGVTFGADANARPPATETGRTFSEARGSDLECLTSAVYFEARGESPRGQAAVAQVVLNRVQHRAFPNSVCAVVYQGAGRKRCQFSFACDGSMRKRREPLAWARARDVAVRALAGAARADVGQATHFHTTAVSPIWAPQMLRVANVGAHVFYKFAPYRLRRASPAAPMASGDALDRAVMTAASGVQAPELTLATSVEGAVEASLGAAAAAPAKASLQVTEARDPKAPEAKAKDATPKDAKTKSVTNPSPSRLKTEEARLKTPQSAGSGAS